MSSEHDAPGTSSDGLAGAHYRSVRHTIEMIRIGVEATRLTREQGQRSAARAVEIGMGEIYRTASMEVERTADEAVKALLAAQGKLEALSGALVRQGA